MRHLSNEKKDPGQLEYIGEYTAQLYEDYNEPFLGSLFNSQGSMESRRVIFWRTALSIGNEGKDESPR